MHVVQPLDCPLAAPAQRELGVPVKALLHLAALVALIWPTLLFAWLLRGCLP